MDSIANENQPVLCSAAHWNRPTLNACCRTTHTADDCSTLNVRENTDIDIMTMWCITQSTATASNFRVPDSYFDSTQRKFERQSEKHKSDKTNGKRTAPNTYHSQKSQRIEHDLNEKLGS